MVSYFMYRMREVTHFPFWRCTARQSDSPQSGAYGTHSSRNTNWMPDCSRVDSVMASGGHVGYPQ